jgi:small subunit ribosomal protein S6
MNYYEIVLLMRKDLTAENIDLLFQDIEKIAENSKAEIILREYWGLRPLAYKINKNSKSHYVMLKIKANNETIEKIEKFARYNEDIVRNKIFNSNDKTEKSRLFLSVKASDNKKNRKETELDAKIAAINIAS